MNHFQADIQKKEQNIRDTAYNLSMQIEALNQLDKVKAGGMFKSVIEYLNESNETGTIFTIEELEKMGYL